MKKTTTAFYIEENSIKDIKTFAAYNQTSLSEIANNAIKDWLVKNKPELDLAKSKEKSVNDLLKNYEEKK
jgi:hypothetical protein